ncbi:MAG: NAD-dependent epimerase/dehydratase family protein [Deltaproteobacteria bacterium]|nr:NAD-dependent epimerase/dehydratase family protein [Deltaproteobacteria bacterium]
MEELINGKRFLVTGAGGFVGSNLVAALLSNGAREVKALDRHSNSLRRLKGAVPVHYELGSQKDPAQASILRASLEDVDYLFHLAAEKHTNTPKPAERYFDANISGTNELLVAAVDAGVRKVVFTSSLYANGRTDPPASREEDLPHPFTVYGISKLCGEHLMSFFARESKLRVCSLRLYFTYGPGQSQTMGYESVITKTFRRLQGGYQPVVYGDGMQALDYVYISDVVRALMAAISPSADGTLLNVCSGQAVRVIDLIRTMISVAKPELASIEHAAADWTAGTWRCGDNSSIKRVLNWEPLVGLREGLEHTWRWLECNK